jgi:hypothetical protein
MAGANSKRRIWQYGAAVLAVAVIGMLGFRMYQNYLGVCRDIGRPLTDDELIDSGIRNVIEKQEERIVRQRYDDDYKLNSPIYDSLPLGVTSPIAIYQNVSDFRKQNPRCCSVNRNYYQKYDYVLYLFGGEPVAVHISYRRYTIGPKPFATATFEVGTCGKANDEAGSNSEEIYRPDLLKREEENVK